MAGFDFKWLHAQANLAFRLVIHYIKKALPFTARYGVERFQQNYLPDGLPPLSPAMRAQAFEAGRCTTCGACDAVCPILRGPQAITVLDDAARTALPAGGVGFLGPMGFVVCGARQAPAFGDIVDTTATLLGSFCGACRRCDEICPEHIPILALAQTVATQQRTILDVAHGRLPIARGGLRNGAGPSDAKRLGATPTTQSSR